MLAQVREMADKLFSPAIKYIFWFDNVNHIRYTELSFTLIRLDAIKILKSVTMNCKERQVNANRQQTRVTSAWWFGLILAINQCLIWLM